ncbi:hypothetical protein MMC13_006868 [Lambiella insularis]|nr:hypothetical protein [Lambiella insularis]
MDVTTRTGPYGQIILFGDSITEQSADQARGFGFMPALQNGKGVIFFGANDACLPSSPTKQHVPLADFKQNIKAIIKHKTVEAHSPNIVLVTTPPVDEYGLETRDLLKGMTEVTRTAEHTGKYARACVQTGQEIDVPVLDLWAAIMTRAGWKVGDKILPGSRSAPPNPILKDLLLDGLHFSPSGYKVLFSEMMKMIDIVWPHLTPQAMTDRFPYYLDAPR